jgi:methionyl-tRNA synthetase
MKFYLTTPIYYVNDKPHIGHAYSTIVADAIARYRRMKGDEVFFLTGTDENSQKNVEAAEAVGEKDLDRYLDEMSAAWQMTWDTLGLSNDDFIRTTEGRHRKGVEKFWTTVLHRGDIEEGEYEGLYCTDCEAFLVVADLLGGKCAIHLKKPKKIKERNYFFRASRYRDDILAHIKVHPEFIQPEARRNEVLQYLQGAFGDISISRMWKTTGYTGGVSAGIPVPGDKTQAIYVWFDALVNYLSAIGYGTNEKRFASLWPADLHIVGKDILKFHAALWPAMLLSAGLELPRAIFAHGFFTVDGKKMSKSLGNVTNPLDIVGKYGNDALRYFVMREIPFGEDGDFSVSKFESRYSADLQHGIGNLARRIVTLGAAHCRRCTFVPECANSSSRLSERLKAETAATWERYTSAMDAISPHGALEAIWAYLGVLDKMLEEEKPWELREPYAEQYGGMLYDFLESLRHVAWMLLPLLPQSAEAIFRSLGIWTKESKRSLSEARSWGGLSLTALDLERGAPLFPPLR